MNLDFKKMDMQESAECRWCDSPLTWINHAIHSVCSHCYDLMANSGLSEDEIAGETDRSGIHTSDI